MEKELEYEPKGEKMCEIETGEQWRKRERGIEVEVEVEVVEGGKEELKAERGQIRNYH